MEARKFASWCMAVFILVVLIVVLGSAAQCQVDIQPSRADQTTIVLGRNLQSGLSGAGAGDCSVPSSACGFNNNFIFPPLYQQEMLCLTVFNNTGSNISMRIKGSATNDPGVTQFQNNQARWAASSGFSGTNNPNTGAVTVNAGTWANFYAQLSGASRVVIILSNTGVVTPGGLDVIVSQQQTFAAAYGPGEVFIGGNQSSILNLQAQFGSATTQSYVIASQTPNSTPGPLETLIDLLDSTEIVNLNTAGSLANGSSCGFTQACLADAPFLSNGTAFDRSAGQSSANATLSATATGSTLQGISVTTSPAGWAVPVQAASASQCTAQLAASATTRHCATGVEACVVATAAQAQLFINLRDGATGAGTVKWNGIISGTIGTFGCVVHEFAGGPICGSLNTAMTLELSAATAATNGCAITVKGYDVK